MMSANHELANNASISALVCPEQMQQTTVFILIYMGHGIKYQVLC